MDSEIAYGHADKDWRLVKTVLVLLSANGCKLHDHTLTYTDFLYELAGQKSKTLNASNQPISWEVQAPKLYNHSWYNNLLCTVGLHMHMQ